MKRPYFPSQPGQPEPLRISVSRVVRFEEVDPLGIVWHGRYPSYFEDARVALGNRFGIGYMDLYRAEVITPIKKMHIDYHRPLCFEDPFTIEGILHWSEAARINIEFILRNGAGEVTTTGYTVQMMMDKENNFLLVAPPFYREFCDLWKSGQLV